MHACAAFTSYCDRDVIIFSPLLTVQSRRGPTPTGLPLVAPDMMRFLSDVHADVSRCVHVATPIFSMPSLP